MSEYVKSAGMKSDEMIRKEAEDQRRYEMEGQRREEEARRKDEEAKLRYEDGKPVDDLTQDERRAAARASAANEKRIRNEKANEEVARKEAERKAAMKPGQWDFELLLEGLRAQLVGMQFRPEEMTKFSATIDKLKETSGYVVEPTMTPHTGYVVDEPAYQGRNQGAQQSSAAFDEREAARKASDATYRPNRP